MELPFILMHPKPPEPPASRPQSGESLQPRMVNPRMRIHHGTEHQFPWKRQRDMLVCVCVSAVPETDPPIDTNLIEFETK